MTREGPSRPSQGEPGAERHPDEAPAAEQVSCDEPEPDAEDDGVLPDVSSVALRRELRRRVRADHLDPPDGHPRVPVIGRHARRDGPETSSDRWGWGYVPRHAVSTPGPSSLSAQAATEEFTRLGRDPTEPSIPVVDEPGPATAPGTSVVGGPGSTNGGPVVTVPGPADSPSEPGAADESLDAGAAAPGKRVRVVLAQRKGTPRPVRTVVDVQEMTPVGETLSTSLIRSQLALALRIGGIAVIALGSVPAIFVIFPVLGRVELFGLRLPWLLLGVLSYPFMLGLAHLHTRSAERLEQVFVDHIQN